MLLIEELFNQAMQIFADKANADVEMVKYCYGFELDNTVEKVNEIYEALYEAAKAEVVDEKLATDEHTVNEIIRLESLVKSYERMERDYTKQANEAEKQSEKDMFTNLAKTRNEWANNARIKADTLAFENTQYTIRERSQ